MFWVTVPVHDRGRSVTSGLGQSLALCILDAPS